MVMRATEPCLSRQQNFNYSDMRYGPNVPLTARTRYASCISRTVSLDGIYSLLAIFSILLYIALVTVNA